MQSSDISWTDATWNPTHGCSKVSAGCANCYAETVSRRFGHTDEPWTAEHAAENVQVKPEKLEEPYAFTPQSSPESWAPNIRKGPHPLRVFANSMSDLFHDEVTDEFIRDVLAVMRNTPHIVYQVLTKRPQRAREMDVEWPPNLWLGTSVEDARVTHRIEEIVDAGAPKTFISFEPLIGEVGEVDLEAVDWVIVGGESGPDSVRREMSHEWVWPIRDAARRDGAAFFFKQSSHRYPERLTQLRLPDGTRTEIREYPDVSDVVFDALYDHFWGGAEEESR